MTRPVTGNFATDFADVLGGLADLAWPLVVIVALIIFKREIAGLFQRARRVSIPGADLELDQALDRARESADRALESVPEQPAERPSEPQVIELSPATPPEGEEEVETEDAEVVDAEPVTPGGAVAGGRAPMERFTQHSRLSHLETFDSGAADRAHVLAEAGRSPRAALMILSALIERRSREVLASTAEPSAWKGTSLGQTLTRLSLSPEVKEAARQFQGVRNRIVHGYAASDEDALRAVDIGLELLDAINRLPHEVHYVIEPYVKLFKDEKGEEPHEGFHGVLLESISEDRRGKHLTRRSITHAFPTTRDHFAKGKPVSWEWDNSRRYPEAWYRDPRDGKIKYGWTASLEFVGRPLEEV